MWACLPWPRSPPHGAARRAGHSGWMTSDLLAPPLASQRPDARDAPSACGGLGRRFVLRLLPTDGGDGWGFTLAETVGGDSVPVATVSPMQAVGFRRAVVAAVAASGYQPTAVSPRRCRPFNLVQAPGVRLALTVTAAAPVSRPGRRRRIADAIGGLTTEEALYWYALSTGPDGGRALRALRLLLADD